MKKSLLIILIAFNIGFSQEYIVTVEGDTLYGETKRIGSDFSNHSFIKFKITDKDKAQKIYLSKIIVFNNENNELKYSLKNPNGYYIFSNKIITGELELYSRKASGLYGNSSYTYAQFVIRHKNISKFFATSDISKKKYKKNTELIVWLKSIFNEKKYLLLEYEKSEMKIDDLKKIIHKFNSSVN